MNFKERCELHDAYRWWLVLLVVIITFLSLIERVYAEQYILVGVSEQDKVQTVEEIVYVEKEESMAVSGTVSPITTLDITLPLSGLYFSIDEERNFQAQRSVIRNDSNCPVDVYVLDISKTNNEPDIVPENTYTEKEWNNLSKGKTLKNMAMRINNIELYEVFNNFSKDRDLALKLGSIRSGFDHTEELELEIDAQYGKNFGKEQLNFQYDLVFEFRVP